MKIPILGDNDDPTAIVGFEVEQMIMPKLAGVHVPKFVASGDFTHQPYIVMERIGGDSLRMRFEQSPLPPEEVAAIGTNNVDHIVIGSRGSSTLRRYLGSVSSQVAAQAECSVTVVKSTGVASQT